MEVKFAKCGECENKNCASCEKILLKVVGNDNKAKELYDTVLAALDAGSKRQCIHTGFARRLHTQELKKAIRTAEIELLLEKLLIK